MEKMTGKEALDVAMEALRHLGSTNNSKNQYEEALATLSTLNVYFSEKPPEGVAPIIYLPISAAQELYEGYGICVTKLGSAKAHAVRYRYDGLVTESDKGGE